MNVQLSTTKYKNLWEENVSTEPLKKFTNNGEFVECVTTTTTNDLNGSGHSTDITRTKISGIYKIVNKINGKYYVGSSKHILGRRGRWNRHKQTLRKNCHSNDHLQNAWNKCGKESFEFVIVEEVPTELLLIAEQKYLDIAKNETDKCYNLSFISDRPEMTDVIIEKMKLTFSKNYKKENHPNFGKHISDDTKRKIGESNSGKIPSLETRKRIGDSLKNTVVVWPNRKGKCHPRHDSTTYKFHNYFTKEEFLGTRFDFYNKYDVNKGTVCDLINGKTKSVKGWMLRK
jgi:group I intron endonuclease